MGNSFLLVVEKLLHLEIVNLPMKNYSFTK